jgi:hypothetical protein
MNTYTIFTSYLLVPTGSTFGQPYSQAVHCNYINRMQITTDNIAIQEVRVNFANADEFKFLNGNVDGTGFTANRIYILVQMVNSGTTDISDVKPISSEWKYYDVTDQILGHGVYLTAADLTSIVFKVPLNNYNSYSTYNLNYLGYPSFNQSNYLCFGDETYFFGDVETEIKADVYTTDLSINLPLNEFNSSNNLTWDGVSKVFISEIGLYDSNKNLVAIGKLNDPVPKDATISRTIVFAIDF